MILDDQLTFSSAQAVTATADSQNVIDSSVARDLGVGDDLYVMATVTTAFTDTGSDSGLTLALVTDDNSTLSSDNVLQTLGTIPALAAAGATYFFKISPAFVNAFERYLGLTYTPTNGNLTTGAITAGIVNGIQRNKMYPANYSVA